MKQKIIEHAKSEFASSPHQYDDSELEFIIKHDCECDNCGKSFFEMDDFPELLIEEDSLLCEECYDEEYRETCIICEENYEIKNRSDYFFITQKNTKDAGIPVGMYKALKYPFYFGDCITGFDGFFKDSIEKVSDMDINKVYEIRNPSNKKEIKADFICPECEEKYLRKDNFIKAEPFYCILMKKERNKLFADYSDERLHRVRQDMIHRRITFRGMLQQFNCKKL